MSQLSSAIALASALALTATGLLQKTTTISVGSGGSPRDRCEWRVDGASVTIEYGRPYLRGRPEELMMPAGQPWRTGADAATVLRTDRRLRFGKVALAPGAYTMFTEPGQTWQLILGTLSKEGQWGSPYQPALERYRVPMVTGRSKEPVDQLTISVDDTRAGGTLRIEWGFTVATVVFSVG
jgi:hypothetical protein